MPIGIGGDITPFDFEVNRSKGKVHVISATLKNVNMVFDLENCFSQCFYIPHVAWSW